MMDGFRSGNSLYCSRECCLCGKKKGGADKFTPGTVRSVDGFSDCPVEFCENCVKGMALAEFDERKKNLGGTFVGKFIDVAAGSITLKDLSGLREKMARSLKKSIEEGLRFNPLAGAYSDLIKVDVGSCRFNIEKGAASANMLASAYARSIVAFSRGMVARGCSDCPTCGTAIRCLSWKTVSFGRCVKESLPTPEFGCAFGCVKVQYDRPTDFNAARLRYVRERGTGIGQFAPAMGNRARGGMEEALFMFGREIGYALRTIKDAAKSAPEKLPPRGSGAGLDDLLAAAGLSSDPERWI